MIFHIPFFALLIVTDGSNRLRLSFFKKSKDGFIRDICYHFATEESSSSPIGAAPVGQRPQNSLKLREKLLECL